MSLKEKQERLTELQAQIDKGYKTLELFQKESKTLREEIRQMEFKNLLPLSPEKVLETNYQVFESSETYQALQNYMRQFKFVKCDGYNPETELKALTIMLSQKEDLKDQLVEINQFLPFVAKVDYKKIDKYGRIPCPQGLAGQIRVVSIFEHTLSENGSYSLLVGDNEMSALMMVRYSSPSILKVLPLNDMISYIRDNHSYELSRETELDLDDEDDD